MGRLSKLAALQTGPPHMCSPSCVTTSCSLPVANSFLLLDTACAPTADCDAVLRLSGNVQSGNVLCPRFPLVSSAGGSSVGSGSSAGDFNHVVASILNPLFSSIISSPQSSILNPLLSPRSSPLLHLQSSPLLFAILIISSPQFSILSSILNLSSPQSSPLLNPQSSILSSPQSSILNPQSEMLSSALNPLLSSIFDNLLSSPNQ